MWRLAATPQEFELALVETIEAHETGDIGVPRRDSDGRRWVPETEHIWARRQIEE